MYLKMFLLVVLIAQGPRVQLKDILVCEDCYQCNEIKSFYSYPVRIEVGVLWKSVHQDKRTLLKERWRTCAVVANSPTLLTFPWGNFIDSADAVFRFNAGYLKLRDLEHLKLHTGSKTTVAILAGDGNGKKFILPALKGKFPMDQRASIYILPLSKKRIILGSIQERQNMTLWWYGYKNEFDSFKKGWSRRKEQIPSSGVANLPLIVQLCGEVRLFGFAWSSPSHPWDAYTNESFNAKSIGLHDEIRLRRQSALCLLDPQIRVFI